MNKDSILDSIKTQLGICEDDTSFDQELIIHINSVLADIVQVGVGPSEGFAIEDETKIWSDFISDSMTLQNVKMYVYLKVRVIFDPPASSIVMNAYTERIKELEFRLFVETDNAKSESQDKPKAKLTKYSDFLYKLDFNKLNYAYGKKYIEEKHKLSIAGCSSVRKNNLVGRNLDWYYNWDASVVVKTEHTNENYKTIGIVGANSLLTKTFMESGEYLTIEEAIPFMIVDGINEHGLFVSTHIIHLEKGRTFGTIPLIEKRDSICMNMLPRYILDKFASADEAINYIKNYVSVYCSKKLWELGMEAHYMIADKTKTYVLEFVNNEVRSYEYNYLTNFYLADVTLNQNGKVYTPETQDDTHDAVITNCITELGIGLERWNLIVDEYATCGNDNAMALLMRNKLNYNRSYTNDTNKWYTEFVGSYNKYGYFATNTPSANYESSNLMKAVKENFEHRNRDQGNNGVWHTTHTAIYDLETGLLTIYDSSEDNSPKLFAI